LFYFGRLFVLIPLTFPFAKPLSLHQEE